MRDVARFRPIGPLAVLLLLGCGDTPADTSRSDAGAVVRITPPRLELTAGARYGLTVDARDQDGVPISTGHLRWSTSNPAVAHADASGEVIAQAPGSTTITARFDKASATTQVDVLPSTVAAVRIDPASVSLPVGEQRSLAARATDAAGAPIGWLGATWSSDNPGIATIDQAGRVAGVAAGTTEIHAQVAAVVGSASVEVTPLVDDRVVAVRVAPAGANLGIGATAQFSATPVNSAGSPLSGLPITWNTADQSVATVAGDGTVTGVGDGITRVVATISGVAGNAIVNVTSGAASGTWPHEPSGFTPITDQSWDILTALGWVVQFGTAAIGLDLSAPDTPPSVLTIFYPIGFAGGSAPGTMTRGITPTRRIFSGLWWKASDPWQGHQSNVNKIAFLFPTSGGDITMVMYGLRNGPYHLRVIPQFPGFASNWLVPNVEDLPVTLGVWHQIEWLIDYSGGTGVGTVEWWMDGRLIGSYDNVPFPSGAMGEFKLSPTWGGVGDSKTENDYFWFDQTYLSSGP